jgi:hypothetical protein
MASKQQPGAILRWKSRRGNTVRGVVETTTERGAWVVLLNNNQTLRMTRAFRTWDAVEVEVEAGAGNPGLTEATTATVSA